MSRPRRERPPRRTPERGRRRKQEPRLIWLREEPNARRPTHTRAEIAEAALEIADAEGFDAVSMRRVAQKLGAGTMTLYHYVANKDELITLMVDSVMGEILVPEDELAGDWRAAMEQIGKRSYKAFANHRWTLDSLGEMRPGPNAMRHFEQSLQAVESAGLTPEETFDLISLVDDYVFGYALREAQDMEDDPDDWPVEFKDFFQHQLDSGEYPRIRELLGEDVGAGIQRIAEISNREGRFERGLARLLDGIEAGMKR
jgi:AcrR family transcriptional regulator